VIFNVVFIFACFCLYGANKLDIFRLSTATQRLTPTSNVNNYVIGKVERNQSILVLLPHNDSNIDKHNYYLF